MSKLSISTIIPVYNCELYLREAIQSVLDQTYSVYEVIVVDDGSTDSSTEIARQFPQIKLLQQSHQGAAAARNHGIEHAIGEWITFLDADDLWMSTKLEEQVKILSTKKPIDIIFTYVQQFISPDIELRRQNVLACPEEAIAGIFPTTTLVRKAIFDQVGYFDETLQTAEFIDWFNRAQTLSIKTFTSPKVLAKRRIHKTNSGITNRQLQNQEYLRVARAALNRRRTMQS